jgi:hypothetical protein
MKTAFLLRFLLNCRQIRLQIFLQVITSKLETDLAFQSENVLENH